jgi:hypothetical protein
MEHERRILWAFLALTIGCLSIGTVLASIWRVDSGTLRLNDLSAARTVEIRDDVERTVLRGDMQPVPSLAGQILKASQLVAMAGDAVGKAEVELTRQANGDLVQEVEIDIAGLAADAHFAVFVDGARVGAIRTDAHGAGEMEHYGKIRSIAALAMD